MTDEGPDGAAPPAGARRFRAGREALSAGLARLLGPRGGAAVLDDAERAAAVAAEFERAYEDAAAHGWARVERWWEGDRLDDVADTLHRLARNVGARDAWLVVRGDGAPPQVAEVASDAVLDNPLGFAALAGRELRLLDREVPAGVWLGRRPHRPGASDAAAGWQLEVWGAEPWLSAATRALRGEG